MTDVLPSAITLSPALPRPGRARWQPLRIGIVELFYYDSEEFWFHDGHLLLRGNNGTGKSKVLSLTLPFLFDAQLRSSRIEPDGDNGKKMAWNLLMGSYPRRIGYAWIEFGRREADGTERYLTLGAGLSAVAGKSLVDSWFFVLESANGEPDPRIGQDVWLTSEQRLVLTKERLREAIEPLGKGQVFEQAYQYRKAVDERLFHLGAKRYDALIDTLIQLRQPQLSKKPDEAGLSQALTEALPPMPTELLADVAEAFNQLEEDRNQLEETRQLEQAVRRFEQRYRIYAGMLTRRQARELRQAQTGFVDASEGRNKAQAELQRTQDAEAGATAALIAARQTLAVMRERLDTLRSDPANQDANRLSQAEKDAGERRNDAAAIGEQCADARRQRDREQERGRLLSRQADTAQRVLLSVRTQCAAAAGEAGLVPLPGDSPLTALAPASLATLAGPALEAAAAELREAATLRRQDIRLLEQHHHKVEGKQEQLRSLHLLEDECRVALESALEQRATADQQAETAGAELIDAWRVYCDSLVQLRFDAAEPLQWLIEWTARPDTANPVLAVLDQAYHRVLADHAGRQAELDIRRRRKDEESAALASERERLAAGLDMFPSPPATRAPGSREIRQGAPVWQLIDFQPQLEAHQCAGLEAALEGSGLLDAWLAPDGALTDAQGAPFLDSHWTSRPPVEGCSLLQVLRPEVSEHGDISPEAVARLLAGVAYGPEDVVSAGSWLSDDGRYRLGALSGAWHKPEAVYIGLAARRRARQRRLAEIAARLAALADEEQLLSQCAAGLAAQRRQAENERSTAPGADTLHAAIRLAAIAAHGVMAARQNLEHAGDRSREGEEELQAARETLQRDALDLRLPADMAALTRISDALERFTEAQYRLFQAILAWQMAWREWRGQQEREREAGEVLAEREAQLRIGEERAAMAAERYQVLYNAIGMRVDHLRQQLSLADGELRRAEQGVDQWQQAQQTAGEARAVAKSLLDAAQTLQAERTSLRLGAVERLQLFTRSGLLSSALPDLTIPDDSAPWTIDPALTLARRAEQALADIADDEAGWTRIRRQVAEDLVELQRALSALGHQASSEPNDWGITVQIRYQNRFERPDALAALLAEDVAQRSELLSAREREVLENHLQAEIAAEIQRLMRAADKQLAAINDELYKRPTTTGVRYRLLWQPLTLGEGAPIGLDIARERLLHTSFDLWSMEDRLVVGSMLQQQIVAERARSDNDPAAASSLIDQLARALDYRHWHRFLVQRLQDGQWRKLSGPASSGERALGLTVPLFAAISSFYSSSGYPLAPRLILLDEAFAGIDDTARAHCMGLINEFDLDFVITSEREWACYATLPGVSICQLQRLEGMNAVYVSRWTWDGRARRPSDDPDRRFPPA